MKKKTDYKPSTNSKRTPAAKPTQAKIKATVAAKARIAAREAAAALDPRPEKVVKPSEATSVMMPAADWQKIVDGMTLLTRTVRELQVEVQRLGGEVAKSLAPAPEYAFVELSDDQIESLPADASVVTVVLNDGHSVSNIAVAWGKDLIIPISVQTFKSHDIKEIQIQ